MKPIGKSKHLVILTIVIASCIILGSCSSSESQDEPAWSDGGESYLTDPTDLSPLRLPEGEKLRVVATTSIVADVVSNVGGEAFELTTLMPANVDPHSFEPTPADLRVVSEAHVVFINGLDLEEFIEEMLQNVGGDVPVVSLSEGINALVLGEESDHGDKGDDVSDGEHREGAFDPHVWLDPANVLIWVDRVVLTLSSLDPEKSSGYETNGQDYKEELLILDDWIDEMVSKVPEEDRLLVTDHRVFEYFAVRYGFDIVGAVIPVFSSAAEPSAREIADLEESIRDLNIKVIFVGVSINPSIVEAVVQDTGTQLVPLYTGSLSDEKGPAGNYIALMRYNVESIVSALVE